jgi:hypothetical protein
MDPSSGCIQKICQIDDATKAAGSVLCRALQLIAEANRIILSTVLEQWERGRDCDTCVSARMSVSNVHRQYYCIV